MLLLYREKFISQNSKTMWCWIDRQTLLSNIKPSQAGQQLQAGQGHIDITLPGWDESVTNQVDGTHKEGVSWVCGRWGRLPNTNNVVLSHVQYFPQLHLAWQTLYCICRAQPLLVLSRLFLITDISLKLEPLCQNMFRFV